MRCLLLALAVSCRFAAVGAKSHNKGSSTTHSAGGGLANKAPASVIILSILGSLFSCCCCGGCCYWGKHWWSVVRPWKRRMSKMAERRRSLKGQKGTVPEILQLWGEFREGLRTEPCEYSWLVTEDGQISGTGQDVDGDATVEGSLVWEGTAGTVLWRECRPGISVEAEGIVEEDPGERGAFVITAEYWSSDLKTTGTIRVQSGGVALRALCEATAGKVDTDSPIILSPDNSPTRTPYGMAAMALAPTGLSPQGLVALAASPLASFAKSPLHTFTKLPSLHDLSPLAIRTPPSGPSPTGRASPPAGTSPLAGGGAAAAASMDSGGGVLLTVYPTSAP